MLSKYYLFNFQKKKKKRRGATLNRRYEAQTELEIRSTFNEPSRNMPSSAWHSPSFR